MGAFDSDHDGIYDFFDVDNDNDGLLNKTECLVVNVDWSTIQPLAPGAPQQTVYNDVNGNPLPFSCKIGNVALTPPSTSFSSGTVQQKNGHDLNFKQSNYLKGGGIRGSVTFDDYSLIKVNAQALSSNISNEDTIVLAGIGAPANFRWVVWELSNGTYYAAGNQIKIAGNHPNLQTGFLVVGTEAIIGVDVYHLNSKSNTFLGINEAAIGFSYLLDTDGDQTPDVLDLDSDNDGIPDAIEAGGNYTLPLEFCSLDNDGNASYPDQNNDNCPDGLVNGVSILFPKDSDMDGIPDYRERDADADNCLDSEELDAWLPSTVNVWNDSTTVDSRGRILYNGTGYCLSPTSNAWQKNCTGICFGPEKDFDGDHIADVNDQDQDNDGIHNQYETNCSFLNTSVNCIGNGSFKELTYLLTWEDPMFNNGIQDGEQTTFNLSNGLEITVSFNYSGTTNWNISDLATNPYVSNYYNASSSKDAITTNNTGSHSLIVQVNAQLNGILYPVELLVIPTNYTAAYQESLTFSSTTLAPVEIIESGGIYTIPGGSSPPFSLKISESGNDGATIFKTKYSSQHTLDFTLTNGTTYNRGLGLAVLLGCDYDQDGFPNHRDLDSDQDGLLDAIEAQCSNAGLLIDCSISNPPVYPDFNLDGCPDGIHQMACTTAPQDNDFDGVPNFLDLDSDNDGCGDGVEVQFHYLVPVNIDSIVYPLLAGSVGSQGQVQDDSIAFCLPAPNFNWLDSTHRLTCVRCDLPDLVLTGPSAFYVCPGQPGLDSIDLSKIPLIDNNPESNTSLNLSYHDAFPPDTSNVLPSPIVQPTYTTTYYILDTEEIHCTDYVPVTIFVDNQAPVVTSLPDSMIDCGVALPYPVDNINDYLIQNTNCRSNLTLDLSNTAVFNDFTNPICAFTPGNTTKAVLSDIFDGDGYVNPDLNGSLDISFDVELISIRDIYGGDPTASMPDAGFDVRQDGSGITGSIPVNVTSNNEMTSGDVKGYMVTVKFAQDLQLYAKHFNLEFTGMNTPGVFFESSALQLLDFNWNPFNGKLLDSDNYSGYFQGKPNLPYGINCAAGSAPGPGYVDSNPWKIAGPGVQAFQDIQVVDSDTDQCNPVPGSANPMTDDPIINASTGMGIHPNTRIGGFRYLVLVENIAASKSSTYPTNGSGLFSSSLKSIRFDSMCLGDPFIADNNPFLPPSVSFLGDVSDNQNPENITRTYAVTDVCGNSTTVQQHFVRERGSDLSTTAILVPGNVAGVSAVGIAICVKELGGFDTDGTPIIVRIPQDPRLTFVWDPGLINVAFSPVQNSQWQYTITPIFHVFTHTGIIPGGQSLALGMEATYDPQGTYGQTTLTSTVVPGSGGECQLLNNTDSEILIYFD